MMLQRLWMKLFVLFAGNESVRDVSIAVQKPRFGPTHGMKMLNGVVNCSLMSARCFLAYCVLFYYVVAVAVAVDRGAVPRVLWS